MAVSSGSLPAIPMNERKYTIVSVIRSQRNLSSYEYENSTANLYNFSRRYTERIPKRRRRWLAYNIESAMNRLYLDAQRITEYYNKDSNAVHEYKRTTAKSCIQQMLDLEKSLMVLWNVQRYETKKMAAWVELANHVIAMFGKVADVDVSNAKLSMLDWKAINEMRFLKVMSELHRYIHGKIVHEKMIYDNSIGASMASVADDAFYSVMKANMRYPTTKAEYEKRKKLMSEAISLLHMLNRSMISYFNLMQCSERVMREWSDLLIEELNLLYAVQASDKKRFGKLK